MQLHHVSLCNTKSILLRFYPKPDEILTFGFLEDRWINLIHEVTNQFGGCIECSIALGNHNRKRLEFRLVV